MACCDDHACSCLVTVGPGLSITGSGTPTNGYLIELADPELIGRLQFLDSESVDFQVTGAATIADPMRVRAISTMKLTGLSDVADPGGGPANGESPVYHGTFPTGHWEFGTLPPAPAGAVNANGGIAGTGTVPDPLHLNVGTWGVGELSGLGVDTTVGLLTYIDVAGKLRAHPALQTVGWADVTGKPATFAPSAHTHTAAAITDPLNLNVGHINGVKITRQYNSILPGAGTEAGELLFFPKGS